MKKYHFINFFVAVLIPTENICFSRCKKWSKALAMYEGGGGGGGGGGDKRSFKLCFLHNFTALISLIAVYVL